MKIITVILALSFLIALASCLSLHLPNCKAPKVGPHLKYSTSSSSSIITVNRIQKEYPIGSILKLWCSNGYQLQGHRHLLCLYKNEVAYWSNKVPTCILKNVPERSHSYSRSDSSSGGGRRKKCPKLRSPFGGAVKLTGTKVGSRAIYSCYKNKFLIGNKIRRCKRNGRWTGSVPFCRGTSKVDCRDPGTPKNGLRKLTKTTLYSIVRYYCQKGFTLIGNSKRRCLKNGKWSGKLPICKEIKLCSKLTAPLKGKVFVKSLRPDSCARYSCDKGYKLIGDKIRVCLKDGKWTGKKPICQGAIKNCKVLSNPENGQVQLNKGTSVGSVALYTCNKGYLLNGGERRKCLEGGIWSGKEPSCDIITCSKLVNPPNGIVKVTGLTYGSIATYTCVSEKFELIGLKNRQCTGRWSGIEPICQPIDCGTLSSPNNGDVKLTGTTPGSVATYSCFFGYKLVGEENRKCSEDGQWTNEAPICDAIDCGTLSSPNNGDVELTGSTPGSVATYSCFFGYKLVGEENRECSEDGQWTNEAPICNAIDCGTLSSPNNGDVKLTGSTPGSVATYSCFFGYKLVGKENRECSEDGQWTNEAPICDAIDCGTLSSPNNGDVKLTGTTPGSVATYSCFFGYKLVGEENRKCSEDGQWTNEAPICDAIDCGTLSSPNNGDVELTGSTPGSVATYSCFFGYKLVGEENRECSEDGQWTNEAPICNAIDCGTLSSPNNGDVKLTGSTPGSVATYSCFFGYKLVGKENRECSEDGQWTNEAPICDAIDCGTLSSPNNGDVKLTGTTPGSVATYSCFFGYKLVGEENRKCSEDGQWTNEAPICDAIDCGTLSSPNNGDVELTGSTPGSVATYSCFFGYKLVGEENRECSEDGQWTNEAPICDAIDCGTLSSPNNGDVELTGSTPGSVATYSCFFGYKLVGEENRECSEDGQWTNEAPICNAIDCGTLSSPNNGDVKLTGSTPGSVATYSCFFGYKLVGKENRECSEDGQWTNEAPICDAIDCGTLSSPNNGDVKLTGTIPGSVATYSCLFGYKLVGKENRECSEDGQWTNEAPICNAIDCGTLSSPNNGDVKLTGSTPGSVATYSCFFGYKLVGKENRECSEDGQWTNEAPICDAIDCGTLSSPNNGDVKLTGTIPGSVATYSCLFGYKLVGKENRECSEDGQWTNEAPICNAIDCGTLSSPNNGDVKLTGSTPGSVATYSCFFGYKLVGKENRECSEDGQWTNEAPICDAIDCGTLSSPNNGDVKLTGTAPGSVATYSCFFGYKLVGKENRECSEDGQWTNEAPICNAIDCGTLSSPNNGDVELTGTTPGSVATYSCFFGYKLVGEENRECSEDGQWTNEAPICDAIDCGTLSSPNNGDVELTGTTPGSVATYSCFFGYKLVGEENRKCSEDGQWTNEAPICDVIDCGRLNNPINGKVNFTSTILSSIASYTCQKGFTLEGNTTRECQINEKWSGSEPKCNEITCPLLSDPIQGHVTVQGTSIGSVATYKCKPGYLIQGENGRICQEDGRWSGEEPFCNGIEDTGCERLSNPEKGHVTVDGLSIGSRAVYTCIEGYYITKGDKIRTCQEGRKWSGIPAVCEPVTCPSLAKLKSGQVKYDSNLLGTEASYSCLTGYTLIGPSIRVCQANRTWSGHEPHCLKSGICQAPQGTLNNGRVFGVGPFQEGDMISYRCDSGYTLMGNEKRICQSNGEFSGKQPTCELAQNSCTGSNTIGYDECGQRCDCRNGELVNCCRVRRDWAELSIQERLGYIEAVKTLASDPNYKSRYETLIKEHLDSFNTTAQYTDPSVSQYLPYSRSFLLKYEELLKEIDCRITIPYWDFTAFPINAYVHPIWHNEIGFGNSSRDGDNCVASGPFSFDKFSTPTGCLKRIYNNRMFPSRSTIDRDILPLPANEFDSFHRNLQLFIGFNTLCTVGGDLCGDNQAGDPIFPLFLSYIDSLLTRWQSFDQERRHVRYSSDDTPLVFSSQTVSDYSDNSNLPNGVSICYSPPVFHKRHAPPPPTSSLLQTSQQQENTNTVSALPDCTDMNFMQMSQEDENFMSSACNREREFENLSQS